MNGKEKKMEIKVLTVGVVSTNCYLCFDEMKRGFIVDPGDNAKEILNIVKEENIQVEKILLTHGHFDHMEAADKIREALGCEIIAGKNEKELLLDPSMNLSRTLVYRDTTLFADTFVSENDVITVGDLKFSVIETPGHTIGGICFYNEKEKVLFSGDTLFSNSIGRTDCPTGDFRALVRSIKGKLFVLPDETTVLPGHGDFTTIGCEKR